MKRSYLAAALSLTACGPVEYRTATMTQSVSCSVGDVALGPALGRFKHSITTYADGFVQTQCFVADSYMSSTGMAAYGPDQKGAYVGGCLVVHDFDEWSGGWWAFTYDGFPGEVGTSRAVYRDYGEGATLGGTEISMECEVTQ